MRNSNHKTVNSVKFKHQINKWIDNRWKNKIIKSNTVRRVSAKINMSFVHVQERLRFLLGLDKEYRVFSLTWSASMQIYWNKRKRLHKKRVKLHRICLGHQHGRHIIFLEHLFGLRDVMWKRSIEFCIFIIRKNFSKIIFLQKELNSTGFVWDTNMAAVSLFWDTNMAAVTSCENTI